MEEDVLRLEDIMDVESVRLAKEDPRILIEEMFMITDKKGEPVPFVFNPPQLKFYNQMTGRDDILKARKEGFSSLVLAIWAIKFLFLENVNCVCISHEAEASKRLFEKVQYYIENMNVGGKRVKVDLKKASEEKMVYKYDKIMKDQKGNVVLDDTGKPRVHTVTNTFYVGTAGSKSFGRGDNIHYLHMSEVAFWVNAGQLITGLANAVPDDLNSTMIIRESTANGYGTVHHANWVAAKEGESVYKPHFFGWNEDPVNVMNKSEYSRLEGDSKISVTNEEMFLANKYSLTIEQLLWRRWKIKSMPSDELLTQDDRFKQEFPISDIEAFLSSGRPVFAPSILDKYEELHVKEPVDYGNLVGWDPPIFEAGTFAESPLKVWKHPISGNNYVIGADVAEVNDFCYATVIDRNTMEQVAEINYKADTHEFAGLLYRLGAYYNDALLAPERNNQGISVVKKLDELRYPNMYRRRSLDTVTGREHDELGWRTDSATRPIMLADLNSDVTQMRFIIRSSLLIKQMRTFVRNSRGRAEAQSGCHDDAVIGNAIALQLYKFLPSGNVELGITKRDYRPGGKINKLSHS
jgi:hypothetical protein